MGLICFATENCYREVSFLYISQLPSQRTKCCCTSYVYLTALSLLCTGAHFPSLQSSRLCRRETHCCCSQARTNKTISSHSSCCVTRFLVKLTDVITCKIRSHAAFLDFLSDFFALNMVKLWGNIFKKRNSNA